MKEPIVGKAISFESGHKGTIYDTQFDFYGRRIATCSSDGGINIFEVGEDKAPSLLSSIKAHIGPVWQLSWAHPRFGSILASCGYDHKVIVWKEKKPNEWEKIKEIDIHKASVNACSWAPWEYGLVLAAGCADGQISVHSLGSDHTWTDQYFEGHKGGVTSITWGPSTYPVMIQNSSNEVLSAPPMRLATGGCDRLVKLWIFLEESKSFNQELIGGHDDWVRDVAFGNNVGLTYEVIASCSEDQTVSIFKKREGKWSEYKLSKFKVPVWRLSWSLTGNILAVATADNIVYMFSEIADDKWELLQEINQSSPAK